MATWGDTSFKIQWGTFTPPHSDDSLNIIDILPDADDMASVAQVKQQAGGRLKHTSFTVVQWPPDLTFYNQLETDKHEGNVREFKGPLGVEMHCVVQHVGQIRYEGGEHVEGAMFFPVVFVEAAAPEEEE